MPAEAFALSVPFRDLAPVVDEWRERTCAAKPSHGVPPHVTLLDPGTARCSPAPPRLSASFGPFDVTFARFDRFPAALWLAPEPPIRSSR